MGDLVNEQPHRKIIEMVCAGTKNYGVLSVSRVDPEDVQAYVKVRGFTLTYNATQILQYEKIKKRMIREL